MVYTWTLTSAVLLCFITSNFPPAATEKSTGERALRLVRFGNSLPSYTSGILQIYYHSSWGTVCNDAHFDSKEADVVCHQLAYSGSSSLVLAWDDTYGYIDDYPYPLVEDVVCADRNYLSLSQCSLYQRYSDECSSYFSYVAISCYASRIWDNPYLGQFRLIDGQYSNQGFLEVYCGGRWHTVCDYGLSSSDATLVCQQFGYSTYTDSQLSLISNSTVGCYDYSFCYESIVSCLGNCRKQLIFDHNNFIVIDCGYSADYDVSTAMKFDYLKMEGPNSDGVIRLFNGYNVSLHNTAGRVQVWYGGKWGSICRDSLFNYAAADVICNQLGWDGAADYSSAEYDGFGEDDLPVTITGLSCDAIDYMTMFECTFNSYLTSSSCTSSNDLSVYCNSERIWEYPFAGQIRLSGGQYSNQGLLEVYCNDRWGTVCDDTFDSISADVVCKQLGYNRAYDHDHLSITGSYNQPIWLDDLYCINKYSCLINCESCPYDAINDCSHTEDITVECSIDIYSPVFTDRSTCKNENLIIANTSSANSTASSGSSGITSVQLTIIVGSILGTVCILLIVFSIAITICIGVFVARSVQRPRVTVVDTATNNQDSCNQQYPYQTQPSHSYNPMQYFQQPHGYIPLQELPEETPIEDESSTQMQPSSNQMQSASETNTDSIQQQEPPPPPYTEAIQDHVVY